MILPYFAGRGQPPAGEMSCVWEQQNEGSLSTLRGQQHKEKNRLSIPRWSGPSCACLRPRPFRGRPSCGPGNPEGPAAQSCHTALQAALVPISLPSVRQRGLRDDGSGGARRLPRSLLPPPLPSVDCRKGHRARDWVGRWFLGGIISLTPPGGPAGLNDQLACSMCLPKNKCIDSTDTRAFSLCQQTINASFMEQDK